MKKYAFEYLVTKNKYDLAKNGYKFVVSSGPDTFIKNNEDRIVELIKGCLPLNRSAPKNTSKYDTYIMDIITNFAYKSPENTWFFLLDKKKIISLCFVSNKKYLYKVGSEYKVDTYTLYPKKSLKKFNTEAVIVNLEHIIYTLCKDFTCPNVGRILLNHVFEYYERKKVDKLYLVQESILFKDNYADIYDIDNCLFINKSQYKKSNTKLSDYYKKIGFSIVDNYYDIYVCINEKDFMFFNVFVKYLSG